MEHRLVRMFLAHPTRMLAMVQSSVFVLCSTNLVLTLRAMQLSGLRFGAGRHNAVIEAVLRPVDAEIGFGCHG